MQCPPRRQSGSTLLESTARKVPTKDAIQTAREAITVDVPPRNPSGKLTKHTIRDTVLST
jgi:hypothetical protein